MKKYRNICSGLLLAACMAVVPPVSVEGASLPESLFQGVGDEDVSRMDFAARFMREIGEKKTGVEYITVSPEMMGKVEDYMNENKADNDEASAVISHVKSVRLVRVSTDGKKYHEKAVALFRKNTHRYALFTGGPAETDSCRIQLWTRKRGDVIVELVVLKLSAENRFELIDLTGEMDEQTLKTLSKTPI